MSEYTPTEEEVRGVYEDRVPFSMVDPGGEFDRFIARIKADAWEEGLGAGCDRWMDSREFGDPPVNPYRQEDER